MYLHWERTVYEYLYLEGTQCTRTAWEGTCVRSYCVGKEHCVPNTCTGRKHCVRNTCSGNGREHCVPLMVVEENTVYLYWE